MSRNKIINRDYDQLLGYVKALEAVERRLEALAKEKSGLLREAQACRFNKRALRELMRLRELGSCPDIDVPTVYEALVNGNLPEDTD